MNVTFMSFLIARQLANKTPRSLAQPNWIELSYGVF